MIIVQIETDEQHVQILKPDMPWIKVIIKRTIVEVFPRVSRESIKVILKKYDAGDSVILLRIITSFDERFICKSKEWIEKLISAWNEIRTHEPEYGDIPSVISIALETGTLFEVPKTDLAN